MMVKKGLAFLVIAFLAVAGCAPTAAKFNKVYMPSASERTSERIALEPEDNKIIADYLNAPKYANDVWLFWLKTNVIYMNVEGRGILAISPESKKVRWLQDAEEKGASKAIEDKVAIANDVDKEALYKRLASHVISSLGHSYSGKLIDNNQELKVSISTDEKRERSGDAFVCAEAKLKAKFVNEKGRARELQWEYNCDWLIRATADVKIPQILRRFQISPSGDYYAYGENLYRAGRRGDGEKLIDDYPIISASIDPSWKKIAVLRNKGNQYWIEIFGIKVN